MFASRVVLSDRIRYVATLVIGLLIALSASVNAKDYSIEYGDQYELCHDLVDLLKDFPDDADPVCGLPEPPEGSLLENLNWEPYDYSRQFILDALTPDRLVTDNEKTDFWLVKEFDKNQPDGSNVKESRIQFSPRHDPITIYKIEVHECELGDFDDLIKVHPHAAPVFHVPNTGGVKLTSIALNNRIDIFRYDGRYHSYALYGGRDDRFVAYEYIVSRNIATSRRVCSLSSK